MADLRRHKAAVREGDTRDQRGRSPHTECPREAIHCHGGPPDMENRQRLEHPIGEGLRNRPDKQIGRIERARLIVRREWCACVEKGVPEREMPGMDLVGREGGKRVVEGIEVATALRDRHALLKKQPPEEEREDDRQQADHANLTAHTRPSPPHHWHTSHQQQGKPQPNDDQHRPRPHQPRKLQYHPNPISPVGNEDD